MKRNDLSVDESVKFFGLWRLYSRSIGSFTKYMSLDVVYREDWVGNDFKFIYFAPSWRHNFILFSSSYSSAFIFISWKCIMNLEVVWLYSHLLKFSFLGKNGVEKNWKKWSFLKIFTSPNILVIQSAQRSISESTGKGEVTAYFLSNKFHQN